jgi:hypothetical protein
MEKSRHKTTDKRKLKKERKGGGGETIDTKIEQTLNPRDRAEKSKSDKL